WYLEPYHPIPDEVLIAVQKVPDGREQVDGPAAKDGDAFLVEHVAFAVHLHHALRAGLRRREGGLGPLGTLQPRGRTAEGEHEEHRDKGRAQSEALHRSLCDHTRSPLSPVYTRGHCQANGSRADSTPIYCHRDFLCTLYNVL